MERPASKSLIHPGIGWIKRILTLGFKLILVFFAFFLSIKTLAYFSFERNIGFLHVRQELIQQWLWKIAFYLHIFGGLLALAAGSLQFFKRVRAWSLKFHRIIGKIYVFSIFVLAAPAGLYLAYHARGGWYAQLAFGILDLVWLITTYLGLHFILFKKDVQRHSEWMTRSFAVTFSAVTLRLWVPILSLGFHMSEMEVLMITPWLAWIGNLIVAELIILFTSPRQSSRL